MGQTPHGYQLEYANIDCATAADHTLVAANAGHKIRLVSMMLRSDDVVTIQFKSGTTAKGGTMQMTDGDIIELPLNEYGWFETTKGEALVLTLSAAKQVSGWLQYFLT